MKSTTAFALVASIIPFAIASPYHMKQHAERDADAKYDVEWVTDVEVVTRYAEVTEYWTGAPSVQTTVVTASASVESAQAKQHHWTWQHSTEAAAETTTAAPAPAAPTSAPEVSTVTIPAPSTSEVVIPAPEPTSSSEVVIPAPSTTEIPVVWSPIASPTSAAVVSQAPSAVNTGAGPYDIQEGSNTLTAYIGTKTGAPGYDLSSGNMQAALVNSTNVWRAMFQAAPVTWNSSLEAMAQDTANKCLFEHTNAGQNLAAGYAGPEAGNEGWAGEWVDYNFANPDFSESAGHFTQVVWQETTTIGCAAVNCGSNKPAQGWYLVCNYFPVGNMLGEFAQNVKPKAY